LVAGVGFEPRPLDYEPKEARLTQRNIRVSKARRFLRSLSGAWSRTYLLPLLQADSQSGGPAPTLTTVGQPDSTVRRARPGERIKTLDGQERALGPDIALVCDPEHAVGILSAIGLVKPGSLAACGRCAACCRSQPRAPRGLRPLLVPAASAAGNERQWVRWVRWVKWVAEYASAASSAARPVACSVGLIRAQQRRRKEPT